MYCEYDYSQIRESFPPNISLEQMRCICHISKKTARFLVQSGLVPSIDTGKKTRRYTIKTADVIRYLQEREAYPEKYRPYTGYYADPWNKDPYPRKVTTLRDRLDLGTQKKLLRYEGFLKKKLEPYPDVLTVREVSEFTGFHHNTVANWCTKGHLQHFQVGKGYVIPKIYLVSFLLSSYLLDCHRPAEKMVSLCNEYNRKSRSKAQRRDR